MEYGQMTPQEIIKRAKELDIVIAADDTALPPEVQATAAAEKMQAQEELRILIGKYFFVVPNVSEILLLSGEGAEKGALAIEKLGGVAVDALELFTKVAAAVKEFDGDAGDGIVTVNAYALLGREVKSLLSSIGSVLENGFNYNLGAQGGNVVDNLRLITRDSAGGLVEEAYILHTVATKAFNTRFEQFPIPVAVYNIDGLMKGQLGRVFKSVHEFELEKGSTNEIRKILSSLKGELEKDGKLNNSQQQ